MCKVETALKKAKIASVYCNNGKFWETEKLSLNTKTVGDVISFLLIEGLSYDEIEDVLNEVEWISPKQAVAAYRREMGERVKNHKFKKVCCEGMIFDGIQEAADHAGVKFGDMYNHLHGRKKTINGKVYKGVL